MHNRFHTRGLSLTALIGLLCILHLPAQKTDPPHGKKPIKKSEPVIETLEESDHEPQEVENNPFFWPAPVESVIRISDKRSIEAIRAEFGPESSKDYLHVMYTGNPAGLLGLKRSLKSQDRAENLSTLESIRRSVRDPETKLTFDAETFDLVLRFVNDTGDCRREAIGALAAVDAVRAVAPLIEIIQDDSIDDNLRAFAMSCLSYTIPTPKSIAFLGRLLNLKQNSELFLSRDVAISVLGDLHIKGTDADRKQIEAILKPFLLQTASQESWMSNPIEELAVHPSPAMLPVFEHFRDDKYVGLDAKEAIVQIRGAGARPLVQSLLDDPQREVDGLFMMPFAWKDDPEAAIKIFQQAIARHQYVSLPTYYLENCWRTCGSKLTQQFVASLPDSAMHVDGESLLKLDYLPIDEDHPLWIKSQALYKAGFLAQPHSLQQLEEMRKMDDRPNGRDFSSLILRYLPGYADLYKFPNDYHHIPQLIERGFLAATGTQFADIECFQHRESWNGSERVRLWINYHDVLYSLSAAPFYKRIPFDSLATLLNALCTDAQVKERFVSIRINGTTEYIYMDPEKVAALEAALG